MKSKFCNKSIFMGLLSTTPMLHLIILTRLFSHVQRLCHTDEGDALLEFKDCFIIRRNASGDPLAYPKVASWSPKEKDDCCSWDGVECDEHNSHVIALNLISSCLYGSINSNSSLFRLSRLQTINLADNDFNGSLVPSQLSHLPSLTYLDLSSSGFSGQIPLEISQLSNLSFLALSLNQLKLKRPDFSTFVRNLSKIKYLSLSHVDISSPIPSFLANFSSLTSPQFPNSNVWEIPTPTVLVQD
ncbi:hypothetical protein TIFTF001_035848 [Ficus carica]|uniref:Leucine-rich repeat-containing N-terminal plant-type domain-containing protein n=1 Tax=Ficus carica TaxID=3494 RepID=A0AA88JC59_FICCA|nr:hypothetical protein TIFTF001_035848 [Ficus carica]